MTHVHAAVNESILRSFDMQNDHFVPVQRDDRHVDIRPTHLCTSKREVLLQCIDEYDMFLIENR